jgi:hypothetical protein
VDEDGDGVNDRLQDSDGDGIINVLDEDSPLYRDPALRGTGAYSRAGVARGFIDEDADGINDRLQDSDGDGIINVLDEDSPLYRDPALRGTGAYSRAGATRGFIDEDADGINDRLQDSDGDGVINCLDQDSNLYCDPALRGARQGRGQVEGRGRGRK